MQIYVEIERARLTKRLAKTKEAEGNINEAADTLQEVAVVRSGPSSGMHHWLSHSRTDSKTFVSFHRLCTRNMASLFQ